MSTDMSIVQSFCWNYLLFSSSSSSSSFYIGQVHHATFNDKVSFGGLHLTIVVFCISQIANDAGFFYNELEVRMSTKLYLYHFVLRVASCGLRPEISTCCGLRVAGCDPKFRLIKGEISGYNFIMRNFALVQFRVAPRNFALIS